MVIAFAAPGDANLDGAVDVFDLPAVDAARAYGQPGSLQPGATTAVPQPIPATAWTVGSVAVLLAGRFRR